MSDINGKPFEIDILGHVFLVIPVYHPSPRNYDKYELIRNIIGDIARDYGTKSRQNEEIEKEENDEKEETGKNSME